MRRFRPMRGGCIALFVFLAAFTAFWTWARDDLFPMQLTQSAPPQGPNRAAVVSDFDLQGDGHHILGVNAGGKWRRLSEIETQSELPEQKWQLFWSRDGSLLALRESAASFGDPRIKTALYSTAFDFSHNKLLEPRSSWGGEPVTPLSEQIETLMRKRGGAIAGRETRRNVGVWRWQDAQWKRLYSEK